MSTAGRSGDMDVASSSTRGDTHTYTTAERSKSSISGRTVEASSQSHTSLQSGSASRRTHSFLGADDRIVLDIGAHVLKAGYSGEARPRILTSSLQQSTLAEESSRKRATAGHGVEVELLWTLDILRSKSRAHQERVIYHLKGRLTRLLRKTVYESLAADPKQRKVIIVENVFLPDVVKQTLQDILFGNLQVASVSFVPTHLMAAVAIGRACALTVDIGFEQATIVPIYFWRPLTPRFVATTTRATHRVKRRLRALLLHFGHFISATPAAGSHGSGSGRRRQKVRSEHLSSSFLDDIIAQALLVGSVIRPDMDLQSPRSTGNISDAPEEGDKMFMGRLRERYEGPTNAKDMMIRIPSPPCPPLLPPSQPSTIGTAATMPTKSPGVISVPGWIRERAIEVLFEPGDQDEPSITELILEMLLRLPVDLRILMSSNIYISGGLAMIPGLAHRIRLELVAALQLAGNDYPLYNLKDLALTLPRVGPAPSKQGNRFAKISSTTEASIKTATSADIDQSFTSARGNESIGDETFQSAASLSEAMRHERAVTAGSMTRAEHSSAIRYRPISQLARHIAVINDHAPRLDPDGHVIGGRAPAFAPNLASWIGASLVGAMRIDSLDATTREKWESKNVQRDAPLAGEIKPALTDQGLPPLTVSPNRPSSSRTGRPSLGSGRGSFLGSTAGLDLGSYGPLSDGAHGTFSATDVRSPTRRH